MTKEFIDANNVTVTRTDEWPPIFGAAIAESSHKGANQRPRRPLCQKQVTAGTDQVFSCHL